MREMNNLSVFNSTCKYEKFSDIGVDDYNIPISDPVSVVLPCYKEVSDIWVRGKDGELERRENLYLINLPTISYKDKLDGLAVTSITHITSFSGVYLHTEVMT